MGLGKGGGGPEQEICPPCNKVVSAMTMTMTMAMTMTMTMAIAPEKIGRPHDGQVTRGHAGERGAEGEQVQVPGQVGQGGQVALR